MSSYGQDGALSSSQGQVVHDPDSGYFLKFCTLVPHLPRLILALPQTSRMETPRGQGIFFLVYFLLPALSPVPGKAENT